MLNDDIPWSWKKLQMKKVLSFKKRWTVLLTARENFWEERIKWEERRKKSKAIQLEKYFFDHYLQVAVFLKNILMFCILDF